MIFLLVIFFIIYSVECLSNGTESSYEPVVEKLLELVNDNKTFGGAVVKVLGQVYGPKTRPEDMYSFFDEWIKFLVQPDNVRHFDNIMSLFYSKSKEGKHLVVSPPGNPWLHAFLGARGHFMDSTQSAAALPAWLEDPYVNISQFIVPPNGHYANFNEFFRREFKRGLRPVCADPKVTVVSPVDANVASFKWLLNPLTTSLPIKGEQLNVGKMLAGSRYAHRFDGGSLVHLDLNVTDYHRFHSPVNGRVRELHRIPGLAYGTVTLEEFFENRMRTLFIIESEDAGMVAFLPIGISDVGSIVPLVREGESVRKGQQLGYFQYGGSTIVMIFERGRSVHWLVDINAKPDGVKVKVNSCLAEVR